MQYIEEKPQVEKVYCILHRNHGMRKCVCIIKLLGVTHTCKQNFKFDMKSIIIIKKYFHSTSEKLTISKHCLFLTHFSLYKIFQFIHMVSRHVYVKWNTTCGPTVKDTRFSHTICLKLLEELFTCKHHVQFTHNILRIILRMV